MRKWKKAIEGRSEGLRTQLFRQLKLYIYRYYLAVTNALGEVRFRQKTILYVTGRGN